MINPTLIRYAFDDTGRNPDNYIKNEQHTLVDKRFRAIAPMYGAFYTEGFSLVDRSTGNLLVRGQDYVFAELYQSLTLEIGKEIAGIALVTNKLISSDIEISYQCVGGDYSVDSVTMESLLSKTSDTEMSLAFLDIDNKPKTFTPSPHMHDLGDVEGMEVLVYQLERLRNAIFWGNSNSIESLFYLVLSEIDNLTAQLINRVNNEYLALVIKYKRDFTKAFAGLGNLANLPLADAQDGKNVFGTPYEEIYIEFDKYVSTEALTAFKEVLYSVMVSSDVSQIGKTYGTMIRSKLSALNDIPPGSTFIIDSLRNVKTYGVDFDSVVYPDAVEQTAQWTIAKMVERSTGRGSVLFAVNMNTGDVYTGHLRVSSAGTVTLQWGRHINERDTEGFLDKLIFHMNDESNPHKDRKHHVGLSDVENLPVASREDIICRKPVRRYITYDGLLLYAKAFLTGLKSEDDIYEDIESPTVLEQYQLIFAPCGPCGTLKEVVKPVVKCDERGKLLLTFCAENFEKKGMYTDGECGTYEESLELNSVECGYVAPVPPPPPIVPVGLAWVVPKYACNDDSSEAFGPLVQDKDIIVPLDVFPLEELLPKLGWADIIPGEMINEDPPYYPNYFVDTSSFISTRDIELNNDYNSIFFDNTKVDQAEINRGLAFAYSEASDAGPINWDTDTIKCYYLSTQNGVAKLSEYDNVGESAPAVPTRENPIAHETVGNVDVFSIYYNYSGYLGGYIYNKPYNQIDGMFFAVLFRDDVALGYLTLVIDPNIYDAEPYRGAIEFIQWNEGFPPYEMYNSSNEA